MSVTTSLTVNLVSNDDGDSAENISGAKLAHTIAHALTLTDGTTANKADIVWSDRRAVVASATDTLDLAAVLSDAFGNTLTFAKVRAIVIVNRNTVAGDTIAVRPAAANGFVTWAGAAGDEVDVDAGGIFVLSSPIDGFVVTAATGDILEVVEQGGANTVNYDIVIVGTTA